MSQLFELKKTRILRTKHNPTISRSFQDLKNSQIQLKLQKILFSNFCDIQVFNSIKKEGQCFKKSIACFTLKRSAFAHQMGSLILDRNFKNQKTFEAFQLKIWLWRWGMLGTWTYQSLTSFGLMPFGLWVKKQKTKKMLTQKTLTQKTITTFGQRLLCFLTKRPSDVDVL